MGDGQLELFECEDVAAAVRREAGLKEEQLEPAARIATRLLGPDGVRMVPRFSTTGVLARVDGKYRIFIRRGVPDANFIIAHELGHWSLSHYGIDAGSIETEEHLANRIGAAIVAPAGAMRAAYRAHGERLPKLAATFGATQSMVWLRLGEVLEDERALVVGDDVRVRSAGRFPWHPPAVRLWARGRAPKGMARAVLRTGYDRGRVVLKAG